MVEYTATKARYVHSLSPCLPATLTALFSDRNGVSADRRIVAGRYVYLPVSCLSAIPTALSRDCNEPGFGKKIAAGQLSLHDLLRKPALDVTVRILKDTSG